MQMMVKRVAAETHLNGTVIDTGAPLETSQSDNMKISTKDLQQGPAGGT